MRCVKLESFQATFHSLPISLNLTKSGVIDAFHILILYFCNSQFFNGEVRVYHCNLLKHEGTGDIGLFMLAAGPTEIMPTINAMQ